MKAILRVSKVKGAGAMAGKSTHNYRLSEVPNADPERAHLNQEYVASGTNIEALIDARIEEAKIGRKIRPDAVKGMEFILTASPEAFERDGNGVVKNDQRNSKWVKANLAFMQERYGKNLVAFTLHQDEKTPHIHAIVTPITDDGKLSAKLMFNPVTLRQLQNDYAAAMAPFGLERGIEGSIRKHESMKQVYGKQTRVEQLSEIIESNKVQIDAQGEEINEREQRIKQLDQEIDQTKKILQESNRQLQRLADQIRDRTKESDKLTQDMARAKQELVQLETRKDTLSNDYHQRVAKLNESLKSSQQRINDLKADISSLETEKDTLTKENSTQRMNLEYIQKQANTARAAMGIPQKPAVDPPGPTQKQSLNPPKQQRS